MESQYRIILISYGSTDEEHCMQVFEFSVLQHNKRRGKSSRTSKAWTYLLWDAKCCTSRAVSDIIGCSYSRPSSKLDCSQITRQTDHRRISRTSPDRVCTFSSGTPYLVFEKEIVRPSTRAALQP